MYRYVVTMRDGAIISRHFFLKKARENAGSTYRIYPKWIYKRLFVEGGL